MLFLLRKPPPENLHGKTVRFVFILMYDFNMINKCINLVEFHPNIQNTYPKEDEQTGNHKKDLLPVCSNIKSTDCNLHIASKNFLLTIHKAQVIFAAFFHSHRHHKKCRYNLLEFKIAHIACFLKIQRFLHKVLLNVLCINVSLSDSVSFCALASYKFAHSSPST